VKCSCFNHQAAARSGRSQRASGAISAPFGQTTVPAFWSNVARRK